jgi:hypothetical protein
MTHAALGARRSSPRPRGPRPAPRGDEMVVIVTVAQDLHALAVQEKVRARGGECHIVECDRVAQRSALSFTIGHQLRDQVLTSEDHHIQLSRARVLWLRTIRSTQILHHPIEDEHAEAIVNNDCRGALLGLLATTFRGRWISTPESTSRGSDKLAQLKAAHDSGFRIPRTLVSQSRPDILDFHRACGAKTVVKAVVGAAGPLLETKLLDPEVFESAAFATAPAIYQEYVAGDDHLRLICFGDQSYAARIHTDDLDWRTNLDVPITAYPVDPLLHTKVRQVLDRLGLEMGVVDIKLTPQGDPVWLEVNPQGQFLFLDAFTHLGLADRFAGYLASVAALSA